MNDKFEIKEYSKNIIKYLGIPLDEDNVVKNEIMGEKINMPMIIQNFDDIMS